MRTHLHVGHLHRRYRHLLVVINEMGWLPPSQTASQCAKIVVLKATEMKGRQP
jgi:hypothetical protein